MNVVVDVEGGGNGLTLCSGVQAVNIDVLQQHTTLEDNSSTVFCFVFISQMYFRLFFAVVVFLHGWKHQHSIIIVLLSSCRVYTTTILLRPCLNVM